VGVLKLVRECRLKRSSLWRFVSDECASNLPSNHQILSSADAKHDEPVERRNHRV
jgi:hypothetical protein